MVSPDKDQIEEFYCVYSQHVTLSPFSLITLFFNCNILIKGTIQPICAESAVKPQSIPLLLYLPSFRACRHGDT